MSDLKSVGIKWEKLKMGFAKNGEALFVIFTFDTHIF